MNLVKNPLYFAMLKNELEVCQILWSKEIGQNPTLDEITDVINKSFPQAQEVWPQAIQTFYKDKIYPLYSTLNEICELQEDTETVPTLSKNIVEESLLSGEANKMTPKANPYHNTETVNFLAEQNIESDNSEEAFVSNNTDTEPSSNVSTYDIRINSEILAVENRQSSPSEQINTTLAEYNIVDISATTIITSEDLETSPHLENKSFTEENNLRTYFIILLFHSRRRYK
jgi:hypothetical protein